MLLDSDIVTDLQTLQKYQNDKIEVSAKWWNPLCMDVIDPAYFKTAPIATMVHRVFAAFADAVANDTSCRGMGFLYA